LARDRWRKIKNAQQRLVLCRLMIDIMRTVHGAYAPDTERFGARLETFFIGLCVALGDMEDKPLSVAKISGYMGVPRTTVIRRLNQLQKWGLIYSRRRRYYTREKTLNSLLGMRSYQEVRRILSKATQELIVLDKLPD
jgi:biotin operon repressor